MINLDAIERAAKKFGVASIQADEFLALVAELRAARAEHQAAFVAGWAAADRDAKALDHEDIADAPDVAYADYIRSAVADAPKELK